MMRLGDFCIFFLIASVSAETSLSSAGYDVVDKFIINRLGGPNEWSYEWWVGETGAEAAFKYAILEESKKWLDSPESSTIHATGGGNCQAVSDVTVQHNISNTCEFDFNYIQGYVFEKNEEEEIHSIAIENEDNMNDKIGDNEYKIGIRKTFKSQIRINFQSSDDAPDEIYNLMTEEERNLPRIGLFVVRTSYDIAREATIVADNYNETEHISCEILSNIITYDNRRCSLNTPNDVSCNTLARIRHHFDTKTNKYVKNNAYEHGYNTISHGHVTTVIKKTDTIGSAKLNLPVETATPVTV